MKITGINKNRLLLLAIFALFITGVVMGQPRSKRKLVENLKREAGSGCAGYFTFAGQSPYSPQIMFFESMGDENDTWMRIDGKDTQLKFVSRSEPTKVGAHGEVRIGSRETEKYVAENISVEIIFTVTWVCPKSNESCESTGYSAIFKVRKGSRREIVRSKGIFGC